MAREIWRGAKAGVGVGEDARDFEGIKKIKFYVIKCLMRERRRNQKPLPGQVEESQVEEATIVHRGLRDSSPPTT